MSNDVTRNISQRDTALLAVAALHAAHMPASHTGYARMLQMF